MGKMSRGLLNERDRIAAEIARLEKMGLAEQNCWLSTSRRKRGDEVKIYWRLNRKVGKKTETEYLGTQESEKYQEIKPMIDRRNEVTELRSQLHLIEQCLERQRNWEG